jgi:putative transposase
MRRLKMPKFTKEQIAFILRQGGEGMAVGTVCREAEISEATYYSWRRKYDGLLLSEMQLREIEDENARLKKIVADLSLEIEMLQGMFHPKQ